MTAITIARTIQPNALDLDARLALVDAAMSVRLDAAAVQFEIRTARIPSADPVPEITAPLPLTPTAPAACPYSTPIAVALHRARVRVETDGWCRDNLYDDDGAICPIRAIRLEAGSGWEADDACVLLLDVIQADFRDAESIPSWNAEQTSADPVLLYLDRAASLAHSRNL